MSKLPDTELTNAEGGRRSPFAARIPRLLSTCAKSSEVRSTPRQIPYRSAPSGSGYKPGRRIAQRASRRNRQGRGAAGSNHYL